MPKELGTISITRKQIRSVDVFQVTARPAGDTLDVYPLIELRDPNTDALIETNQAPPQRFSQAEIEAVIGQINELPDYPTLRVGLAKLMHALLDTR